MMLRMPRRLGKSAILLLAVALFAAFAPAASAADKRETSVMTRNMYLGADLGPALEATNELELVLAADQVWDNVQTNDIEARAELMADEIAATRPALIGLQEATLWRTYTPEETVAFDYLAILDAALRDRGLDYGVVASLDNFDSGPVPTFSGPAVRLTDRLAVLADLSLRADKLKLSNVQSSHFSTLLTIPTVVLGNVTVERGWIAMDVKMRGKTFRFVNTHLEAFHPSVRTAQAGELLAGPAHTPLPVMMAGDFNSAPSGDPSTAYGLLMGSGGFTDAWPELHPSDPGLTCCFGEVLDDPNDSLSSRIDLVIYRGPWTPLASQVVGDHPDDFDDLWPSDHAGVVTELRLDLPR